MDAKNKNEPQIDADNFPRSLFVPGTQRDPPPDRRGVAFRVIVLSLVDAYKIDQLPRSDRRDAPELLTTAE
jgi:hypothetical protein